MDENGDEDEVKSVRKEKRSGNSLSSCIAGEKEIVGVLERYLVGGPDSRVCLPRI
jgi:hypothetical protein